MLAFARFIDIDWSGRASYARANTSTEFPIQVVEYDQASRRLTTLAPPSVGRGTASRWSRTVVLEWLVEMASGETSGEGAALVGLDFAFSFPYCDKSIFFPGRAEPGHWVELLQLAACRVGPDFSPLPFLNDMQFGEHFLTESRKGQLYERRFRVTEQPRFLLHQTPASVFKVVGGDQVGRGAIAGMAWIAELRKQLGDALFVWPLDGIDLPAGTKVVLVEVFPRMLYEMAGVPPDSHRYPKVFRLALQGLSVDQVDGRPLEAVGTWVGEDRADAMIIAASMATHAPDRSVWDAPRQLATDAYQLEGWIWGAGVPRVFGQREGMNFREIETARIYNLRTKLFSPPAAETLGVNGLLAPEHRAENLHTDIRERATGYFAAKRIQWHGKDGPDHSVVSSQVACINFFFPLISCPGELAIVLRKVYPELRDVLPIDPDDRLADGSLAHLTFEWIGKRNYLKEPGRRVRGKYVTNADVVFRFRDALDRIHVVLVEWKYCEAYRPDHPCHTSKQGTDRTQIYQPHISERGCQLTLDSLPIGELFYEPFEQLMRLQLLASAMEREREMDADIVSVLLVAPRANRDFLDTITSPALLGQGGTVSDVWRALVAPDRFHFLAAEDLLEAICALPDDRAWLKYLVRRYGRC